MAISVGSIGSDAFRDYKRLPQPSAGCTPLSSSSCWAMTPPYVKALNALQSPGYSSLHIKEPGLVPGLLLIYST